MVLTDNEYDLVGQLIKRAVEVGEGWDDNKLMNAAAERILRQQEEIVRLSVDAARYNYLRSQKIDTIHGGGVFAGVTPANVVINGQDLDSMVDNARLNLT